MPEPHAEIVRALRALADENEGWEWSAPVGPGNASYANGYENGRRAVGAELRDLLAAIDPSSRPAPFIDGGMGVLTAVRLMQGPDATEPIVLVGECDLPIDLIESLKEPRTRPTEGGGDRG